MTTVRMYNPLGRTIEAKAPAAQGPIGDLTGKTIAILENTKPNARELMRHVADHLHARFDDVTISEHRKVSAAQPAEERIVDRIRAEATLVLVGSGD